MTLSLNAHAFEIYPEYQGISETELARIESPAEIDSEYQSQINAYTTPLAWESAWIRSNRALDTSVGSITNQHFLVRSRAKFRAELSDSLRFDFTYFADRDRENDQTRHIFELSQRLTTWLRVNAYGEPDHYKRGNDFGFALLVQPSETWENRFYYTLHDLTRGNHNDQPDRFVGLDPVSLGWQSVFRENDRWLRAGARFDRSVAWNLPQASRNFAYEKQIAYAEGLWPIAAAHALGLRLQWDATFKQQTPLSGAGPTTSWKRERALTRVSYQINGDDDPLNHEWAVMYASRHWMNQNGAHLYHQNLMPALTTRVRGPRREKGFDHLQLALEATDFRAHGDLGLTPSGQRHEALEGRLQAAYEFSFRNDAALMLAFNFDVDEWLGLPTFDGGNARFRADF